MVGRYTHFFSWLTELLCLLDVADGGPIEILWNLIQDGSKASQEVISHARVKLEEILNDYSYRVCRLPPLFRLLDFC